MWAWGALRPLDDVVSGASDLTDQFRAVTIMAGGEALKTVDFQSVAAADAADRPHLKVVPSIQLDRSRDDLLTDFAADRRRLR